MKLTKKPKRIVWPETHYAFVEKVGAFPVTAGKAWQRLHKLVPKISEHNEIKGYMALYKVEARVYRAGVALAASSKKLPAGLKYVKFKGGPYSRFVLQGPYDQLLEACGQVFETVVKLKIKMRKDFCIENYLTDPNVTPPEKTVTEILVPST